MRKLPTLLLSCLATACAGTPVNESIRDGGARLEAAADRVVEGSRNELERTHEAASTIERLIGPRQHEPGRVRRAPGPTPELERLESAGATAASLWQRELERLDPPGPLRGSPRAPAFPVLLR